MSGVRYSWMWWDNHRKVPSTGGYLATIRVEYHYQEVSISMDKYYIDRRNMFSVSWNSNATHTRHWRLNDVTVTRFLDQTPDGVVVLRGHDDEYAK